MPTNEEFTRNLYKVAEVKDLVIENGKVKSFSCYIAATVLLGQLGVLGNLGASFSK